MIVPDNYENLTEEELISAYEKMGFTHELAVYIAGKLKGTIKDDKPLI